MPGEVSLAGKLQKESPITKTQTEEDLKVLIRDAKLRKILIKEGCAYETNANILLEIPWKEIEGDNCRILVECEDESRQKKQFYIDCVYSKH